MLSFIEEADESKRLSTLAGHIQLGQYGMAKGMMHSVYQKCNKLGLLKLLGDAVRWGCIRQDANEESVGYYGPCWYWWRSIPVGESNSIPGMYHFRQMVFDDYQYFASAYVREHGQESTLPCPLIADTDDVRTADIPHFLAYLAQGTLSTELRRLCPSETSNLNALMNWYISHYQHKLITHTFLPAEIEFSSLTPRDASDILYNIFDTKGYKAIAHKLLLGLCKVTSEGEALFQMFQGHVCTSLTSLHSLPVVLTSLPYLSLSYDDDVAEDCPASIPLEELFTILVKKFPSHTQHSLMVSALMSTHLPTALPILQRVIHSGIDTSGVSRMLGTKGAPVDWDSLTQISAAGHGSPFHIIFSKALAVIDEHLSRGVDNDKHLGSALAPLINPQDTQPLRWLLLVVLSTGVAGVPWKRRRVTFGACFRMLAEMPGDLPEDPVLQYLAKNAIYEGSMYHTLAGMLVRAAGSPQGEVVIRGMVGDEAMDILARILGRDTGSWRSSDADADDERLDQVGRVASALARHKESSLLSILQPFLSLLDLDAVSTLLASRPVLDDAHRRYRQRELSVLRSLGVLDVLLKAILRPRSTEDVTSHMISHMEGITWPSLKIVTLVHCLRLLFLKRATLKKDTDLCSGQKKPYLCDPAVVLAVTQVVTKMCEAIVDDEDADDSDVQRAQAVMRWAASITERMSLARWVMEYDNKGLPKGCLISHALLPAASYLVVALNRNDYVRAKQIRLFFTQRRTSPTPDDGLKQLLYELRFNSTDQPAQSFIERIDKSIKRGETSSLLGEHLPSQVVRKSGDELLSIEEVVLGEADPFKENETHAGRLVLTLMQRQGWQGIHFDGGAEMLQAVGGNTSIVGMFVEYMRRASLAISPGPELLSMLPTDHMRRMIYETHQFKAVEEYAKLIRINPRRSAFSLLSQKRDENEAVPNISVPVVKWLSRNKQHCNVDTVLACLLLQTGGEWDHSLLHCAAQMATNLPSPHVARWIALRLQALEHLVEVYGMSSKPGVPLHEKPLPLDTERIIKSLTLGTSSVHPAHHSKLTLITNEKKHELDMEADDVALQALRRISDLIGIEDDASNEYKQIFEVACEGLEFLKLAVNSKNIPADEFYSGLADRHKYSTSLDEALSCIAHNDETVAGPPDSALIDAAHLLLRTALQLKKPKPDLSARLVTAASSFMQRVKVPSMIAGEFLLSDVYAPLLTHSVLSDVLQIIPHDVSSVQNLRESTTLHFELLSNSKTAQLVKDVARLELLDTERAEELLECIENPFQALSVFKALGTKDDDKFRQMHCECISFLINEGRYFEVSQYLDEVGEKYGEDETREVCLTFASSRSQTLEAKEIVAEFGCVQHEVKLGLSLLNSLSDSQRGSVMILVKRPDLLAEQLLRDGKIHNVHKALLDFPDVVGTNVLVFYAKRSMEVAGAKARSTANKHLTPTTPRFKEDDPHRVSFRYSQAPCLALCRSLVLVITDNQVAGKVCMDIAEEMGDLLKVANPPKGRKWILSAMEELIVMAQRRLMGGFGELIGRCDSLLSKVKLLKSIEVAVGFRYDRWTPWDEGWNMNDTKGDIIKALDLEGLLDRTKVTKVVECLVSWDRMDLALNVCTKCGMAPDAVWVAWGRAAIKLGDWEAAKLYFGKSNPSVVCANLKEIQECLEGPPMQRHATFTTDGRMQPPPPDKGPSSKASFTAGLNKMRYQQAVWYTDNYGMEEDVVTFYVRRNELQKAVAHIIQKKQPASCFVTKVVKPMRQKGDLATLRSALLRQDQSLASCRHLLFGMCRYLRDLINKSSGSSKAALLEELFEWQTWMCDHVRSALTARDRFILENDVEKQTRLIELAESSLRLALDERQPYQQLSDSRPGSTASTPVETSLATPTLTPPTATLSFNTTNNATGVSPGLRKKDSLIDDLMLEAPVLNAKGISLPPCCLDEAGIREILEVVELQKAALRVLRDSLPGKRCTLFGSQEEQRIIAERTLVYDFAVGFQIIRKLNLPRQTTFLKAVSHCVTTGNEKKVEATLRQMKNTLPSEDLDKIVLSCVEQFAEVMSSDTKAAERIIPLISAPSMEAAKAWLLCKKWKKAYFIAAELADRPQGMDLIQTVLDMCLNQAGPSMEGKKV